MSGDLRLASKRQQHEDVTDGGQVVYYQPLGIDTPVVQSYVSAVLQCLAAVPSLAAIFAPDKEEMYEGSMTRVLRSFFADMKLGYVGDVVNPYPFIDVLERRDSHYGRKENADAADALRCVLEVLLEEANMPDNINEFKLEDPRFTRFGIMSPQWEKPVVMTEKQRKLFWSIGERTMEDRALGLGIEMESEISSPTASPPSVGNIDLTVLQEKIRRGGLKEFGSEISWGSSAENIARADEPSPTMKLTDSDLSAFFRAEKVNNKENIPPISTIGSKTSSSEREATKPMEKEFEPQGEKEGGDDLYWEMDPNKEGDSAAQERAAKKFKFDQLEVRRKANLGQLPLYRPQPDICFTDQFQRTMLGSTVLAVVSDTCGTRYPTSYLPHFVLPLPIVRYPDDTVGSLKASLERKFASKAFDAGGQLWCETSIKWQRLQQHSGTVRCEMEHAPRVLCFQLERFSTKNGKCVKESAKVPFPEVLDISNFVAPHLEKHNLSYRLMAMMKHSGTERTENSFYEAYVRGDKAEHGPDFATKDRWFLCRGKSVVELSAETVFDQQAYVLIYERVNFSWNDHIPEGEPARMMSLLMKAGHDLAQADDDETEVEED